MARTKKMAEGTKMPMESAAQPAAPVVQQKAQIPAAPAMPSMQTKPAVTENPATAANKAKKQ